MLWTPEKQFANEPFETEAQLEAAILQLTEPLFGPSRIYLAPKKLIGAKTRNIPDGYLIDLSSKKAPRLFVVEVELASHEPLKHIAVQILEFSLSFETSPYKVKGILRDALNAAKSARACCEQYAVANGFENLDFLLEKMVQGVNKFNALVIIDDIDEELETVLLSRFKFPVEILTLKRFKAPDNSRAYQFEPFLADLSEPGGPGAKATPSIDPADIDTIVVPAQEEGFKETFLGENRWHHIRIDASMIPQIKYVAVYRVAPVSAITHVAPVKDIQLWEETSKYVLNFTEPAKEIGPIKLPPGSTKFPQAPRYTSMKRLVKAKTIEDVF